MRFEIFIAKKFHFNENGRQSVSRPAVRVATMGVAVGLTVMILAVSVIIGFKREIQEKVIGFGSDIQVTHYDRNSSFETQPVFVTDSLICDLYAVPQVKWVQRFATKPGIIKTDSEFLGIVIKGIDAGFDTTFISKNLVAGSMPQFNDSLMQNGVLLSKTIADALHLQVGDGFLTYFMQNTVRVRKFTVTGVYNTNIAEYDKIFVLADIKHVQKLNGWTSEQASGLEVKVKDYARLEEIADAVFMKIANRFDEMGSMYYVQTIKQVNPQIFAWLDLLDMNAWVILVLMLLVAGFNIISGLLILILERTNSIGLLKSMGADNWTIRKIFLCQSVFLIGKGMFWGNVVGVSFCLIQYFTHFIPLDPEVYYVSSVPVSVDVSYWLLLNAGTAVLSLLMLVGPSVVITRISPAKSMRFE